MTAANGSKIAKVCNWRSATSSYVITYTGYFIQSIAKCSPSGSFSFGDCDALSASELLPLLEVSISVDLSGLRRLLARKEWMSYLTVFCFLELLSSELLPFCMYEAWRECRWGKVCYLNSKQPQKLHHSMLQHNCTALLANEKLQLYTDVRQLASGTH